MKKFVSLLLLAASLAVSARAGVVAGASVGYLVDSEEAYYSARLGYQFNTATSFAHQIEVEYGYSQFEDSGVETSLAPITLNYRASSAAGNKFAYHVGAGAGVAQIEIDYLWYEGKDQPLAVQGFAGVDYHCTPNLSLNLDAKYLWIDDVEILGTSFEVGDDVVLSAGLTFKF